MYIYVIYIPENPALLRRIQKPVSLYPWLYTITSGLLAKWQKLVYIYMTWRKMRWKTTVDALEWVSWTSVISSGTQPSFEIRVVMGNRGLIVLMYLRRSLRGPPRR